VDLGGGNRRGAVSTGKSEANPAGNGGVFVWPRGEIRQWLNLVFQIEPPPEIWREFLATSCGNLLVARKFQRQDSSPVNAGIGVITLRMAALSLAGVRVPPRARKIPTMWCHLPVTMLAQSPQPVIMRHALQNVGSPVSEIQLAQSPPV
jgi:hypothetical protein